MKRSNRAVRILILAAVPLLVGTAHSQTPNSTARDVYQQWRALDDKFILTSPYGVSNYGGRTWTNLNPATDADWYSISITDVISSTGSFVTAWMRGNHKNNPKVKYRTTTFQQVFDCSARRMRTPIYIEYGADGEIMFQREDYGRYETAIPGTHGEHWLDVACRNK